MDQRPLIDSIAKVLDEFCPTLLIVPSLEDFHPDHRAAYRAIMEAVAGSAVRPLLTLSYVVHGDLRSRERRSINITSDERARKSRAIQRHGTQLLLSRRRFLGYAAREEQYGVVSDFAPGEESWTTTLIAKLRHVLSLF